MGFTAAAVVGGLLLGLLFGGRPSNLGRRPLRWWPVLGLGVLLQAAAEIFDVRGTAGLTLVGLSYAGLALFALRNLRLVGMPIVLLGLVLNMTVIGVNGGMPVREDAVRAAGDLTTEEARSLRFGAKRHLEDDSDRLVILGDVIPVRLTGEVLSFGDLLLAFGIANVLFRLLRPAGDAGTAGRRTKADHGAEDGAEDGADDGVRIERDARRDPVVPVGPTG